MAAADERPHRPEVCLSVGWRRRGKRSAGPVRAMEQDVENTAEHVLHLVRSRMSTEIPLGTTGIQNPSATRIVDTFRARFATACDAGVWKRLSNAVLEPANPFDVKVGRQFRQEVLILGTLVFVALGLAVYFNVGAIAR